MSTDGRRVLTRLAAGQPPDIALARQLMVGFDRALIDWRGDLAGYIAGGGSLLRVVSAPAGSGKTHLARTLQAEAASAGYAVCQIDAAADHTDDDLALYRAFCAGVRCPTDIAEGRPDKGLGRILRYIAMEGGAGSGVAGGEARRRCRLAGDVPVPSLAEYLPLVLEALRAESAGILSRDRQTDLEVVLSLVAGEPVEGTRALGRLRTKFGGPLVRALRKVPGQRDARLWLETLLRLLAKLGLCGVLWVVDEHDQANPALLDRHIVQLRRLSDRLAEGRIVGVFAVYLVMDDFGTRIKQKHGALEQRLQPILGASLTRRPLAMLEHLRALEPEAFLRDLGQRLYGLVEPGPMPEALADHCRARAKAASRLGGVDVRSFVQSVASQILDVVA